MIEFPRQRGFKTNINTSSGHANWIIEFSLELTIIRVNSCVESIEKIENSNSNNNNNNQRCHLNIFKKLRTYLRCESTISQVSTPAPMPKP